MTLPILSHSPQHRACRVARSPVVLLSVALLYALVAVVLRDGHHGSMGMMALRGSDASDDDGDEVRRAAAEWEPEIPIRDRNAFGDASRGPVKGGVEIYPVQPARRPRKVTVPLVPEVSEIEGVPTAWKMPGIFASGGGEAIKGIYLMFHGCHHSHLDWFDLAEERTIVGYLVRHGYAVVAPASMDRSSGCWTLGAGDGDISRVKTMLWRWYRDWSMPPNTPLFLFGASSGGTMATALGSQGGFQLCEKRTTYVRVSGVMAQVSWGIDPVNYAAGCPPLGFMPMPKGEPADVGDEVSNAPPVFGNSRKIPPRITAIAHNVRKSGGRPRMLLLPLGELSIYKSFFSDRVYEVTEEQSSRLHAALLASRAMECNAARFVDGERECFLKKNPREIPPILETLVATYEAASQDSASDKEGPAVQVNATRPLLSSEHATEVFRELLNVAWGAHELSADFVALWEPWMWDSCGDNCRPGPWR